MNVTWWLLLIEYLYATACINSACVAMFAQRELQDCYKTVGLNTACITNASHSSSIPAHVHFAHKARKFVQGCKQVVSSHSLQSYSQWQHSILALIKLKYKSFKHNKTANVSGKIVYLWTCMVHFHSLRCFMILFPE